MELFSIRIQRTFQLVSTSWKEAVSGSFCGVTRNTCSIGIIRAPSLQKWMKRSIISISLRKVGVGNSNI